MMGEIVRGMAGDGTVSGVGARVWLVSSGTAKGREGLRAENATYSERIRSE